MIQKFENQKYQDRDLKGEEWPPNLTTIDNILFLMPQKAEMDII